MKLALLALAALIAAPAWAGDPAPYVLHEGRAVTSAPSAAPAASAPAAAPSSGAAAVRAPSAFGTSSIQAGISYGSGAPSGGSSSSFVSARPAASGRGFGVRAVRSTRRSGRRGVTGSTVPGGTTPASSGPPPFATIGAKIITEGQPPVYSDPGNAGTHSVEGGGFVAIDQSRANDVGRAPGIFWAPPDTPPSSGHSGGGGSGASANGPAAGSSPVGAPAVAPQTNRGASGATGFDPSF